MVAGLMTGPALVEMNGLLRCCLLGGGGLDEDEEEEEEAWLGLGSSCSASCRWEDTQPLSEPVEPERQRDDEPELSVVMEGWLLVSCSCSSSSMQELMNDPSAAPAGGSV